jgi:tight adherence protein C
MPGLFYRLSQQCPALLLAVAVEIAIEAVLVIRLPDFEVRGRRAGNRLRALSGNRLLPLLMPVIHFFTAVTLLFPLARLRSRLNTWLHQGDDPLGLVPSEILGICLFCGLCLGVLAAWLATPLAALPAFALGAYLPYSFTRNAAAQRIDDIGRSIPMLTDLIALCMESGMDFLGAVRLLLAKTIVDSGEMPIRDELLHLLNQLQLGRDRRSALLQFSQRAPSEAVRMLTTCVLQAEEKGMALRDVLRIQAEVMRHKRIQQAEAYVQLANLQMMAPILLVILALLITVLVPMVGGMSDTLMTGGIGS